MECAPEPKFVVVNAAAPFVSSANCVRKFGPSQKDTVPVGIPGPGGLAATVAVNVTALLEPRFAELRLVVVALAWTFCTNVAFALGKAASPLYSAVTK